MLERWGTRFAASLAGIAAGLLLSSILLDRFSIGLVSLVWATLIFWVVHMVTQLIALRTLVRQPSVALAGLLALGSTIVSLILVNLIVEGIRIKGIETYVMAALIIWLTTALGDTLAIRRLRARRLAE